MTDRIQFSSAGATRKREYPITHLIVLSDAEGHVLDQRVAGSAEEARTAAQDILSGLANLNYGDTLKVIAR